MCVFVPKRAELFISLPSSLDIGQVCVLVTGHTLQLCLCMYWLISSIVDINFLPSFNYIYNYQFRSEGSAKVHVRGYYKYISIDFPSLLPSFALFCELCWHADLSTLSKLQRVCYKHFSLLVFLVIYFFSSRCQTLCFKGGILCCKKTIDTNKEREREWKGRKNNLNGTSDEKWLRSGWTDGQRQERERTSNGFRRRNIAADTCTSIVATSSSCTLTSNLWLLTFYNWQREEEYLKNFSLLFSKLRNGDGD